MKRPSLRGLTVGVSLLVLGVLPEPRLTCPGTLASLAWAQDTVVLSQCTLKGAQPLPRGQQLLDAPQGSRSLGQFTGAVAPLTATLPVEMSSRAKVSTSASKPTVRIDGWMPASLLPIHTARDVPVLQGNLWLASGYRVQPVKATGSQLTAELTVQGSQDRKIRGTASCDAFSLDRTRPTPLDIPGNARGYLTKGTSFTLFDSPNGTEILEMTMVDGASQLFWSTESKGAFVHVISRGDLVIDAWIRLRELSPLKKGEMMDQYIPPTSQFAGAQLKLEQDPKLHTASREIPIRLRPDEKEKPIGVVEKGAEIYEVGSTPKWINVLPRDLYITPPSDAGYWIPSDALTNK
ncbi:MAG: hypothetical protein RMJ98_18640 [Myxococcales bacterium]|nr:hypothetical protein [Polyangiaceae bacterium]MDW8251318.1 hypothetical protein [Myxococcales bacterium]